MMGADMHRYRAQVVQFAQQLLAVAAGGEIGLVIAEPGIDRLVGTDQLVPKIHGDRDRRRLGQRRPAGQHHQGGQAQARLIVPPVGICRAASMPVMLA